MGFSPKTESEDGDELEMACDRKGGQRAPARIRHRHVSDRKRNTKNELQSRRRHHVTELSKWLQATENRQNSGAKSATAS
jgi:hypothetical protein